MYVVHEDLNECIRNSLSHVKSALFLVSLKTECLFCVGRVFVSAAAAHALRVTNHIIACVIII
jgi:hypothetical protein